MSDQFDFVALDETRALEPLERSALWEGGEVAETFPSGLKGECRRRDELVVNSDAGEESVHAAERAIERGGQLEQRPR